MDWCSFLWNVGLSQHCSVQELQVKKGIELGELIE